MTTLMTLARPRIETTLSDEIDIASVSLDHATEHQVTLRPMAGETPRQVAARLRDALADRGIEAMKVTGFGSVDARLPFGDALNRPEWPMTWVDGANCWGGRIAGVIVHGVSGAPVERLDLDGQALGSAFEDGDVRQYAFAGIHPLGIDRGRPVQAREAFCRMEAVLEAAGLGFRDVARTWLFVDRILDWYDDLNPVRTGVFRERSIFAGLVPASTGVGTANPAGAAMACEVLAFTGAEVSAVSSPLQCSARDYGSSFSRAVEVEAGAARRLYVSGTASIAPEGETIHIGNCAAQIATTLDVVEAILASRGMGFGDVTRSIAYFRHPSDAPLFAEFMEARGLPAFPVVVTQADICRDNLLFEIELDAAKA